jgi:uncharacterized protein (TIGR02246 family)
MPKQEAGPASVQDALLAIRQAWERGAAADYAALFTPDADYTAFDGTRMAGRREIEDGHRPLFAGIMRGSMMTSEPANIRYVRDDVAVATVRGGIIMRWQKGRTSPSPKRVSALTYVFVRDNGRWLATAFHNTRYRPWKRTPMGRLVTSMASRSGTR